MRVVLSNSYGTLNKGDEAILTVLVQELKALGHDVEMLTFTPGATAQRQPGATAIRSGVFRGAISTVRAIRRSDLLIIGGGGIIQDATSLGNLVFHLSRAVMALAMGTPYTFCGVGIGPLKRKISRKMTAMACARSMIVSVRDSESARLLASIGIDRAVVDGDLAHLLRLEKHPICKELAKCRESGKPLIGLSMRPLVGDFRRRKASTPAFRSYLDKSARLADRMIEQYDAHIVFISMHPDQDDPLAERIAMRMRQPERLILVSGALTPGEIKSAIAEIDLLIGTRLHAIILAACSNVPVIGIAYDEKIRAYLEELGLKRYLLEKDTWEVEAAAALASIALSESDRIRDLLRERIPIVAGRAKRAIVSAISSVE